ncbi:SUN domain-containing protein 3-like [Balearica regulorum gibbericeps]|uniref:SUN domain-containing protein 3-like n=1 Tax=Balearica regulorum gibbericeps TaxID=100784 RepID=UPI003F5F1181
MSSSQTSREEEVREKRTKNHLLQISSFLFVLEDLKACAAKERPSGCKKRGTKLNLSPRERNTAWTWRLTSVTSEGPPCTERQKLQKPGKGTEIAEVLARSRASRMFGARTSADTGRLPPKAHDLNGPAGDELGEALSDTLTLEEQLRKVQGELYHLRWSAKDIAERAVQEALKQAELPGFTGWAVQEIIDHVVEKVEENQVPMPDYALKSSGAAVIHSRTSPSLWNTKGKVFLYSLPLVDYVRSPEVILEPDNHPGNCWPFPGSRGHVLIKLSLPITPRAVTMDHVSGSAFHRDSIPSAPKDFAVYGLKEGREEQGTFLGEFMFLAALNPRQTFQLKNELSGVVKYIRLEVLSNWGHPDYTCLYRFRVHGDPPKDDGGRGVSFVWQ